MGRAPREPSAAELARQADTCVACQRLGTRKERVILDGHGLVPLCADPTNCREHAEKVGIYRAA